MDESYYLQVDGKFRGPYTVPQIRSLYARGFVSPETPFWLDGMDEPRPVRTLFTRPPIRWGRVLVRWLFLPMAFAALWTVLALFFREEVLAFADSAAVGEFLRKAIYILFFKEL